MRLRKWLNVEIPRAGTIGMRRCSKHLVVQWNFPSDRFSEERDEHRAVFPLQASRGRRR
jgi:hypothetical protein